MTVRSVRSPSHVPGDPRPPAASSWLERRLIDIVMRFIRMSLLAGVGPLMLAVGLHAQESTAPGDGGWGDAVNGIRLRVTVPPVSTSRPAPTTIHLPLFEVQIGNERNSAIRVVTWCFVSGIEIDGVSYRQIRAGNLASTTDIAPRSESARFPTVFSEVNLVGTESGASPLLLTAGRHVVRVIATIQNPPITVKSNALAIDIPGVSASVERQTLINLVGTGKPELWTAWPILVAKYPDAALGAAQSAIRATDDPSLPGMLISWLGRIPGDDVTAFLRTRLARGNDFYSRASAGEALLRRGDRSMLGMAVATWRDLLPSLAGPPSMTERDAAGVLITILAQNGDSAMIDTLALTMRQTNVMVRIAAVRAFMPAGAGGWTADGDAISLNGVIDSLPTGRPGASIVRLLRAALDDREAQNNVTMSFGSDQLRNPRVCDVAAMVFAMRWPDRYQFHWGASTAQRDTEIEVIRRATFRSRGPVNSVRQRKT
jgi:hypothetical protein